MAANMDSVVLACEKLNHKVSEAKQATVGEQVKPTDCATLSHASVTHEDCRKPRKQAPPDGAQLLDKVSMQEDLDIDFERLNFEPRPLEL